MARHKNIVWAIDEKNPEFPGAQLAVLMDIRDELQTLNRLLGCHNFIRIPAVLDSIAKNTKKKVRKSVAPH